MSTKLVKRKENKHEKERRRRHMKCLLDLLIFMDLTKTHKHILTTQLKSSNT
jgi:hypothetical protein